MNLSKEDILQLSRQYDEESPDGVRREEELGRKIRNEKEVGMDLLKEIVNWKFKSLPGRIKRTHNLLRGQSDEFVRSVTSRALSINMSRDDERISELRKIKGVGISLASVILTFHDPDNYCIYDIHIMRELYGRVPRYMFTSNNHYLRLLKDLRAQSRKFGISVRTIEKALFKKNIE